MSSVVLADDVDEGWASFGDDDVRRAPDSSLDSLRIIDRSFPEPAERTRDRGEVGRGLVDLHADVRPALVRAARAGDPFLMLPVVVVGAVVEHHREQGDSVVRGDPERAEVEHQVPVRLQVDDEAAAPLVRESDAEGDADLSRGAEARARMAV